MKLFFPHEPSSLKFRLKEKPKRAWILANIELNFFAPSGRRCWNKRWNEKWCWQFTASVHISQIHAHTFITSLAVSKVINGTLKTNKKQIDFLFLLFLMASYSLHAGKGKCLLEKGCRLSFIFLKFWAYFFKLIYDCKQP